MNSAHLSFREVSIECTHLTHGSCRSRCLGEGRSSGWCCSLTVFPTDFSMLFLEKSIKLSEWAGTRSLSKLDFILTTASDFEGISTSQDNTGVKILSFQWVLSEWLNEREELSEWPFTVYIAVIPSNQTGEIVTETYLGNAPHILVAFFIDCCITLKLSEETSQTKSKFKFIFSLLIVVDITMWVLVNDSKGIQAAPIVHGYQFLSQLFNLFNCLNLLHYDFEHSIFNVKLFDFLPLPIVVVFHGGSVATLISIWGWSHHQLKTTQYVKKWWSYSMKAMRLSLFLSKLVTSMKHSCSPTMTLFSFKNIKMSRVVM